MNIFKKKTLVPTVIINFNAMRPHACSYNEVTGMTEFDYFEAQTFKHKVIALYTSLEQHNSLVTDFKQYLINTNIHGISLGIA